ncbi:MAG: hypothetical protein KIPDCIKN_03868 [Haliscomenobacter sp.]|nr:hypothetical protein [Haliscomenobacter sp.]
MNHSSDEKGVRHRVSRRFFRVIRVIRDSDDEAQKGNRGRGLGEVLGTRQGPRASLRPGDNAGNYRAAGGQCRRKTLRLYIFTNHQPLTTNHQPLTPQRPTQRFWQGGERNGLNSGFH